VCAEMTSTMSARSRNESMSSVLIFAIVYRTLSQITLQRRGS
jgi:hypothetical protein